MPRDWDQVLSRFSAKDIKLEGLTSIAEMLGRAFEQHYDKVAISFMGHDIYYADLEAKIARFAGFLQSELRLKKGDRLAIMLPNCPQFVVAFLAAQKVGVICVNTNPLYTPREMLHQFRDSGATAIVILDLMAAKLEKILDQTLIRHIVVSSIADELPRAKRWLTKGLIKLRRAAPPFALDYTPWSKALAHPYESSLLKADLGLDDLAMLQYTGGTTGVAKGAMLSQRNILANMLQCLEVSRSACADGTETVLTAQPLYHIFALSINMLALMAAGQHLILVPRPIPIRNTARMFKKYRISIAMGVNTLFNALNHDPLFRKLRPQVKFTFAGGMALQKSVAEEWQQITSGIIFQGYGLTECSPLTHVSPPDGSGPIGSIGVPVASTEAKVVGPDGKPVPHGETGELVIKGPQVMVGYWQRPDESAQVLKAGWLWTGDLARRDKNGYFWIVDRTKDMIVVSGFKVYPSEVEEVLAAHPKVLEVAVVGLPDAAGNEIVKAFVVKRDPSLTETELTHHAREQLTGYKVPRLIEFRSELPKSNVGKVLRRALREED